MTAAVFTASPTLSGVDHGSFTLSRVATQTSSPPSVPNRFEEKTSSRPSFRGAVAAARNGDDPEVLAGALVGSGGGLVHSARGTDEEGAAALHEGTTLVEQVGRHDLAATGWREISWVPFMRAHYERAEASLARPPRSLRETTRSWPRSR